MAPRRSAARRPAFPIAASLLVSSAIIAPISGHALPHQTVAPTATADTLTWPIQSTLAPVIPPLLAGRDFNTVCGYIGGNPNLPATCIEGTHCVVDVEHNAIGCCPDEGDCTTGIFTGCVDDKNPGRSVVDPHIYTCGVGDVCYKNTFQGGFFQYGCGSASEMATTVAFTAAGKPAIAYTTVSVSLRPTVTLTTETSSDGRAPSSTLGRDSKPTGKNSTEVDGGVNHTSVIVGGTVGGAIALFLLFVLAAFLWRRKKNSKAAEAEEEPKFISRPLASPDNDYEDIDDMTDTRPAPKPPGPTSQSEEEIESWPIPPGTKGGVIGGANGVMETDKTPLTQHNALAPINNIDNFSPVDTGSVPRRGGERPFWQQTGGGRTRNLTRS
ncbi:hypothetical protein ISF_05838 [Cordyceps fumosorosea ARSEF 2679]|uniref:Uncharacterized protein n=1 Tax=Cordyceps fumosorosea (strain ARSEF 2679) TaxID=1081104 RepID=A0A167TP36_CORFA|nr:hypothetical protein ISF_05838 [Cordyceps fumosorosea ARSEF 2679]OAA60799.1 hypothetical protein ISF_05838 [Cordyceps fumosorosea ARSEF 2679]